MELYSTTDSYQVIKFVNFSDTSLKKYNFLSPCFHHNILKSVYSAMILSEKLKWNFLKMPSKVESFFNNALHALLEMVEKALFPKEMFCLYGSFKTIQLFENTWESTSVEMVENIFFLK